MLAAGGASSVVLATLSGLEVAGTVGGIIGVLATIFTLAVTVTANNRTRRREYEDELRQARLDGAQAARAATESRIRNLIDELGQARSERDFYRDRYFGNGGRVDYHQAHLPEDEDGQA